jgi:hypothetical protein
MTYAAGHLRVPKTGIAQPMRSACGLGKKELTLQQGRSLPHPQCLAASKTVKVTCYVHRRALA